MFDADPWSRAADLLDPPPHPYHERTAAWCREHLFEYVTIDQGSIYDAVRDHRYTAVQSCHDVGKGLALDTPLPTPRGWTTMGNVRPGDWLLNEDGRPVRVSWVSPVRNIDCFRVAFDDGEIIVCDRDHLWSTIDRHDRRPAVTDWREHWDRAATRATADLVVTIHGQREHRIPTCRPLALPRAQLPVEPYGLGVWLGDGHAASASLTCFDQPIIDQLRERGWEITARKNGSYYMGMQRGCGDTLLRVAGVYRNKHIPPSYLRAAASQRLEVLRGLMDTDGFTVRGSLVGIDLCDERLARDVAELIRSFGWRVRIRKGVIREDGIEIGVRYRMHFSPDRCPFHLPRKAALWMRPTRQRSRTTCRTIISIESVSSVPTRCLAVESPTEMFLAGEGMIPTHNSHGAARLVAHFIETNPSGENEAFAVTTAPTDPQVKAILWRYIGQVWRKGRLKGRITLDAQWKMVHAYGPDEPIAYGRKPADQNMAAFQGIHARRVLIVIDEAGGVPKAIFDAVDSLATNEGARVLAIGNPDDPASHFAKVCQPGSGWHVIRLDAFRSPNFTKDQLAKYPEVRRLMIAEGIKPSSEPIPDSVRPMLVSPAWVNERIRRWGVGTPMWDSKVRGKFPKVSHDTLIQPAWITAAVNRDIEPVDVDPAMGVDVARFGRNHSIILLRLGGWARVMHDIPYGPTTEVAGLVQALGMGRINTPVARVDDPGVGGGVVDILREDGYPVMAMLPGGACSEDEKLPNGKPRFVDARSEWWWRLREWLAGLSGTGDDGRLDLDGDDEDMLAQIGAIKYFINRHGQIRVERKDEMEGRGLPSPDRGDALVMSLVPVDTSKVPLLDRMMTGDLLSTEW